jgi:serine/threonine-protein kinase haspin
LHEGQILITPCPVSSASADPLDPYSTGVKATVIDFGLSRLKAADERVIWSEIPQEVFEGAGDQWDVYRAMRNKVQGDWKGYHPSTNVMVSCLLLFMRFGCS